MPKKRTVTPRIQEVHDFNPRIAAKELLKFGFTAVDDIGGHLIERAEDELFDELGLMADAMEIQRDEIESVIGPIFVFRDCSRVTLRTAKEWVARQFPLPPPP